MGKGSTGSSRKRQVQGYKSEIKGLRFEQKVVGYFSKKGWEIDSRKRMSGGEIDIYGKQTDLFRGESYLLVECKDKEHVSAKDVMHFMKKVTDFHNHLPRDPFGHKPSVKVVLAYTGEIDKDAKKVAFRPKIEFKKF
jgi:Holliday junction resolvase